MRDPPLSVQVHLDDEATGDTMSAGTAVGTIRTYARIPSERQFTYDDWKAAVRAGNTFVTYGPLMEFSVDGRPAGSRI